MISIIGGGPVGNYAAYLLAKKGHEVHVYEEHNKIGEPVQCTGIVTSELAKIIPLKKEFVINKVNFAKIYSPNGKHIKVRLKKPNLIIDRSEFDKYLAKLAKKAGAKIHLGQKFEGIRNGKLIINGKEIPTEYLIGADGPNSKVSRYICKQKKKRIIGIQARVKRNVAPNVVEFFLGQGEFAWLVPESADISRVGLVDSKNLNEQFEKLMDEEGGEIINKQGGLIPLYNPNQRIQNRKIIVIGDAAGQVKPTTYGGLIPGLLAAQELSKSLKNYETNCKKKLGKDLRLGLLMRKAMNKFSNKDYDQLVEYFAQPRIKTIIETENRDFPSRFILKILIREPRLLKFATKLIS